MKALLNRLLEVLLILSIVYMLAGCHTINGVGKDLEKMTSKYVEKD